MNGDDLEIIGGITIPAYQIQLTAIRSQGPGGQNVNKVASAVHLRFDVLSSALSPEQKQRICAYGDTRITSDGVIVIKAQNHRSQIKNKQEALRRLQSLLSQALKRQKPRRATRPSRGAVKRRLEKKSQRSQIKVARRKVGRDD